MLSKQAGSVAEKLDFDPNIDGSTASRVITIASGKGGVGKSNLVINLAIQFAKSGRRCVVVDADLGNTNAFASIGVASQYNLSAVLDGSKEITDILVDGPGGIRFVSGGAGFSKLANEANRQNLNPVEANRQISLLLEKIAPLDDISDIILIDTGAGMSNLVVDFVAASYEAVIMITPEAASVTDAYAVIKRAKEENANLQSLKVVVNRAESKSAGDEIFGKLERACNKFLKVELNNIGYLPHDPNLIKAVKAKQPVSIMYPDSPIVKNFELLEEYFVNVENSAAIDSGFKVYMQNLIKKFNNI